MTDSIFENLGGREQFDKVDVQLHRTDKEDPVSNEQAQASLRISVKSKNLDLVGRMFNAKITELGLANLPGWTGRGDQKKILDIELSVAKKLREHIKTY